MEDNIETEVVQTKNKKIGKNVIFNFISQFLTLVLPLITAPYLARVLHEEGNGRIAYSLSIVTYFVIFANLGFDIYGQRKIATHQDDKEVVSKAFWEMLILKLFFTSISLGILCVWLLTIGFGNNYDFLILILAIQVIAVPFDIQFLFRGKENFAAIAIRSIIVRLVCLICIFCFVKTENDAWIYALCYSGSIIISNVIMWFSVHKYVSLVNIKDLNLRRHIKPAILIFLPTLAIIVYSVFDKTMIGLLAKNPDYENGCYEQAYKLNSIILLLVTIISAVFISRNANEYKKNGIEAIKTNLYFASNYVWLMGFPLIVGVNVLSGNLCSWFLGEGYNEVPLLLGIMSVRFISSGFAEVFGNQLFIAIGKEKYYTIAVFIVAFINITLNAIMIPFLGATGAAIATAISEVTVTTILGLLVYKKKYLSFKPIFLCSWKYIIAAGIMFFPIYFVNKAMPYSILSFLICTAIGMITYFIVLVLLRDKFLMKLLIAIKNKFKKKELKEE